MDFAERLSLWLNAFDAIGLQAAHQSLRTLRAAAPGRAGAQRIQPLQDVERVRGVLARRIEQAVPAEAADETARPYAAFHDAHQDLQRQMGLMIAPLRAHLREALERAAPALRQLAVLDAALAQVLAPRAQALLASLPSLLQRRFAQVRAATAGGGDWRDTFTREWRQALLAELELRLAPCTGLAEALANESPTSR